ncbi:MAG TPA: PstS family phosphate ABC transporter substrate-binding protein [Verrucomicrobiota bacterium]|nr:PstS family phosphate ABC transporter substrate-binding protein [Verrucomicrobiota bacterium]
MRTDCKSIALALAMLAGAGSARAGNITVKGSDTLVILAQKWAEVYMQQSPATKIQVTGGGTGTGFAALQNQTTDLCNASRKIRAKEIEACVKAFGKRPTEYKVALDGLSIYVHESNPIEQISIEELEGIFTARIRNWKEVGGTDQPIVVYSRENSSGTYEFFKEHVLKGKDFASSAQTLQGTAQVLQAVAGEPKSIGYGGAAYGAGAKHIKVSKEKGGAAVEPSEETVVGGAYPIWRYLYIYVNPALDKGEVAAYLNWIRSDAGQKVVKDIGYFPLPKQFRQ